MVSLLELVQVLSWTLLKYKRNSLSKVTQPISDNCCCLLITFANILDSDQFNKIVQPDLGPNCMEVLIMFLQDFFFLNQSIAKKQPADLDQHGFQNKKYLS